MSHTLLLMKVDGLYETIVRPRDCRLKPGGFVPIIILDARGFFVSF